MKSFLPFFIFFCSCTVCSCAFSRSAIDEEPTIVAWYIEDLAHGNTRYPGEISMVRASDSMKKIEGWLAGHAQRDRIAQPRFMDQRIQRWPMLHGMMNTGAVVVIESGAYRGFLAPAKGLSRSDMSMTSSLVDAENNDRRALDALIASSSLPTDTHWEQYADAVALARIALDHAAGAQLWNGKLAP